MSLNATVRAIQTLRSQAGTLEMECAWDESKHERQGGRFASNGGSGSGGAKPRKGRKTSAATKHTRQSPKPVKPVPFYSFGLSRAEHDRVSAEVQKHGSSSARRRPRARVLAALKAGRAVRLTLKPVRIKACRFRDRLSAGVTLRAKGKSLVRRFSGTAYTGGIMHPKVTIDGVSKAMDVILDLDSLTIPDQVRPVLDDHDESTDGLIGQTAMVARRGRELIISGKLYGWKLRAKQILAAARAGHVWQLSVGTDGFTLDDVAAGQAVTVNGQTFRGPVKVARGAYLTDFSFVAVGADDRTSAVIAARRR